MKVAKLISRIFAIGCSVAALAMFFFPIAKIAEVGTGTFYDLFGYQLAFGMKTTSWAGTTADLQVSSYYTFAFLTVAFSAVMACLSFKKNSYMIASFVSSIISTILAIMFISATPGTYVDWRPIVSTAAGREYLPCFYLLFAFVLGTLVLTAVAVLVADLVEVKESNGKKKTIFARIVTFIREYKSEITKITCPGVGTVAKNTLVVFVVCAIIGVFIFLLDFGLGWLLETVLSLKK